MSSVFRIVYQCCCCMDGPTFLGMDHLEKLAPVNEEIPLTELEELDIEAALNFD